MNDSDATSAWIMKIVVPSAAPRICTFFITLADSCACAYGFCRSIDAMQWHVQRLFYCCKS